MPPDLMKPRLGRVGLQRGVESWGVNGEQMWYSGLLGGILLLLESNTGKKMYLTASRTRTRTAYFVLDTVELFNIP